MPFPCNYTHMSMDFIGLTDGTNEHQLESNNIRSPPSTYDPSPSACNRFSSLPTASDGYQRLPVTSCQVLTSFRWLTMTSRNSHLFPAKSNTERYRSCRIPSGSHEAYVGVRCPLTYYLANGGCITPFPCSGFSSLLSLTTSSDMFLAMDTVSSIFSSIGNEASLEDFGLKNVGFFGIDTTSPQPRTHRLNGWAQINPETRLPSLQNH